MMAKQRSGQIPYKKDLTNFLINCGGAVYLSSEYKQTGKIIIRGNVIANDRMNKIRNSAKESGFKIIIEELADNQFTNSFIYLRVYNSEA